MGKTIGIAGPLMKSGSFLGPMVGGILLSHAGYWRIWIAAYMIIIVDLVLRLVMTERPKAPAESPQGADASAADETAAERGALLPHERDEEPGERREEPLEATVEPLSNLSFYLFLLKQPRISASLLLSVLQGITYNSFNATLPLHVEELFGWNSEQTGFLFLALVGPSIVLGPFAGWLRDRVGVKGPTMAGTLITIPAFVLLGAAGDPKIPWAQGDGGKAALISGLILMGLGIEFTVGTCFIEGTRKCCG